MLINKKIKFFTLGLLFIFILNSCSGITGSKKENNDEFLVQKKSPLLMPPNYNELPTPKEGDLLTEKNNSNVKDLISGSEDQKSISTNSNSTNSIEKSVLDKIKQ